MNHAPPPKTTPEPLPPQPSAPKDSALTLAALGILAYAASMMTHEALGHGLYCVAVGGHNSMLTAWGERCDFPTRIGPPIAAAGPAVQFTAGLLAWLALPHLPARATRLRFFVWLLMVFNLFIASGYVAFSGVTGIGDAAVVIANLHPPLAWRTTLILLGSALYFLSMRAAATELHRFASPAASSLAAAVPTAVISRSASSDGASSDAASLKPDSFNAGSLSPATTSPDAGSRSLDDVSPNPAAPLRRLFRLVSIPYAAAGLFACCTAAFNHTMGPHVALGFAAASSLGSGSGLFGLPTLHRPLPPPPLPSPTNYVTWSTAWAAAAAVVLALLVIGPGLE